MSALYTSLITKEIVKKLSDRDELHTFAVSESQARSLAGLLQFKLEQVRTAMSDPNSSKKTCDAKLKVVLPIDMLEKTESVRQNLKSALYNGANIRIMSTPVRELLSIDHFDIEVNTINKDTTFKIQPTDDGKTIVITSKDLSDKADTIAYLLVLQSSEQIVQDLKSRAEIQKQQDEENELNLVKEKFLLDKDYNQKTKNQINALWKALPEFVKTQLLQEQKTWVAQKYVECGKTESPKVVSPQTMDEYIAAQGVLKCDTKMTQERLNYLKNLND